MIRRSHCAVAERSSTLHGCRVVELKAKYDGRNLFRDLYYWRPRESNSVDFSSQDVDGAVAR